MEGKNFSGDHHVQLSPLTPVEPSVETLNFDCSVTSVQPSLMEIIGKEPCGLQFKTILLNNSKVTEI